MSLLNSITPLRYVKKCRNLGQTQEFVRDFQYKPNQPDPNSSQVIAFLDSKFLNNKFLNTPKECSITRLVDKADWLSSLTGLFNPL